MTAFHSAAAPYWWERPDLHYGHGRLYFAGRDVAVLAAAADAPLYLYSADRVRANLDRLCEALAGTGQDYRVYYAMKANRFAPLLGMLAETGQCGLDICSPNEMDLAIACGFRPDQLSFTGTGVSQRDLDRLLVHDDMIINCDTIGMIRRIGERRPGRQIGIRVNPGRGVGYGDSEKLTYAGARTTKFGIYRAQWEEALDVARAHDLRITNLHFHVGCGYLNRQLGEWEAAMQGGLEFLTDLPDVTMVNIGGGLGLPHRAADTVLDLEKWASALRRNFAGRPVGVAVEPGDYLVKDAGLLVLGVTDVERKSDTLFVSVDGGFNLHPEPVFYDLPCEPAPCVPRGSGGDEWQVCTIAGNINEALDLWAENIRLPPLLEGDFIAFLNAGGYGAAMASHHCLRDDFTETWLQ